MIRGWLALGAAAVALACTTQAEAAAFVTYTVQVQGARTSFSAGGHDVFNGFYEEIFTLALPTDLPAATYLGAPSSSLVITYGTPIASSEFVATGYVRTDSLGTTLSFGSFATYSYDEIDLAFDQPYTDGTGFPTGNLLSARYKFGNSGTIPLPSGQDTRRPTIAGAVSVSFSDTQPVFVGLSSTFRQITAPTLPLPEPASWVMMILGFGAIGVAMRSRRRAALTA